MGTKRSSCQDKEVVEEVGEVVNLASVFYIRIY
jgi:hypothetical protein